MVQLACSCLNIRLHVQESPESLVAGIPNLSPSERQHPFFLKSDANKIQMLQKCDGYSPVFNLVLPTALDSQSPPPLSPTEFPGDRSPETDAALSDIQQQMTRFLKKAQSQVEANIQSYTKQQQAALQALTYRARQDRQTVMRLISNMQANLHSQAEDDVLCGFDMDGARPRQSDPFSTHSRMGLGEADDGLDDDVPGLREESEGEIPPLVSLQVRGNSQPLTMNHAQGVTAGMRNMRLSSSMAVPRASKHDGRQVAQSLDVEGLFDMEGMTDGGMVGGILPCHSEDEDDTDDSIIGEGMHIPGGRDSIRDLAKSVPVNVPMWAAARAKPMPEPRVIERPSDINQMGASIKALARSVHTTSVDLFGDLPRPRQPL